MGFWAYSNLAWVLGHLGRRAEAASALARLDEMKPDFSLELLSPFKNPDHFRHHVDGLRKAGLEIPDEPAAE